MARKIKRSLVRKINTPYYASDFWAFTTVFAFPAALLISQYLNFGPTASFLWGMGASLAALCANSYAEGRLWMFDPKWRARFDQPDFSFRLAVVTGAVLLLLESVVIVMLFTGNFERNTLALVYERHCQPTTPEYQEFCEMLDRTLARRAP